MTKKKKTRRRFTEEFKAETVKLVKQSDRSMSSLSDERRFVARFDRLVFTLKMEPPHESISLSLGA
jgi:hypothetical protein